MNLQRGNGNGGRTQRTVRMKFVNGQNGWRGGGSEQAICPFCNTTTILLYGADGGLSYSMGCPHYNTTAGHGLDLEAVYIGDADVVLTPKQWAAVGAVQRLGYVVPGQDVGGIKVHANTLRSLVKRGIMATADRNGDVVYVRA